MEKTSQVLETAKIFIQALVKAQEICRETFYGQMMIMPNDVDLDLPVDDRKKPYFMAGFHFNAPDFFKEGQSEWLAYVSYTFDVGQYAQINWQQRTMTTFKENADELTQWICQSVAVLKNQRSIADPEWKQQ